MGLGLSGIVPTMHFTIEEGFVKATTVGQMGWFYLMGAMYITGAGLYAARIPERYFPGKCDIWVSTERLVTQLLSSVWNWLTLIQITVLFIKMVELF